jgi:hypothetical protein
VEKAGGQLERENMERRNQQADDNDKKHEKKK